MGKVKANVQGKPVAVKKVNVPIEEEGMILNSVNHPNVIQYYGVIHSPPNYALVMEYAENGSLAEFLHKEQQAIDFGCKESFIQQILSGMFQLVTFREMFFWGGKLGLLWYKVVWTTSPNQNVF